MNETYFIEENRNGEYELYEKDGTFASHDTQDLLIAIFFDKKKAEAVAKLLNSVSTD